MPSIEELLSDSPLYVNYDVVESGHDVVQELFDGSIKVDLYCHICKNDSIFIRNARRAVYRNDSTSPRFNHEVPGKLEELFIVRISCVRNSEHLYYCIFRFKDNTLTKIGQYPSIVDFCFRETIRYKNLLSVDSLEELRKAIYLAAHSIGIGSFIYLRRVFENLIMNHRVSSDHREWPTKIEDQIEHLKDVLPKFLVEKRHLYKIMSKAVHQLDEQSCKEIFPVIRDGIILILNQDFENKQRQINERRLAVEIDRIEQSLS